MSEIEAIWVHKTGLKEAKKALAMLNPPKEKPTSLKGASEQSDWRTFYVHSGCMFVPNTPESEGYFYDMFTWEKHPTYEFMRTGKRKTTEE